MAILENLESSIPDDVNPKVVKIIEEMINDPEHQELMKKLAGIEESTWDNEGGMVTPELIKDYEERLKYMEDHGI